MPKHCFFPAVSSGKLRLRGILSGFDTCRNTFRILSARLRHIRATAAATAYNRCNLLDQVACMGSLGDCALACCRYEVDLSVNHGRKDYHTVGETILHPVAEIAKAVHVKVRNIGCENLDSVNLLHIAENIRKGGIGKLRLQQP